MEEVQKKKKFPKWVILLLVLFGLFVMGSLVIGFGIRHFFGGKRGEDFAKMATEKIFEKAIEEAGEGKLDVKINTGKGEQGIAVKSKETGEQFAFNVTDKLPENFPSDLAVFNPSTFKGHVHVMGMQSFSWQSEKPVREVVQFYQSKMGANGWQVINTTNDDNSYSASFKKGNKQAIVNLSGRGGTTEISLLYGGQ